MARRWASQAPERVLHQNLKDQAGSSQFRKPWLSWPLCEGQRTGDAARLFRCRRWIGGSIVHGVQFVSMQNFQYFESYRSHAQKGRWQQIWFQNNGLDFKSLSITFDFGLSCLLEGLANESFTIDHPICKSLSTSSCIVDALQIMCCLCKTCKRLWSSVCLWIYLDCNTVIYFCCTFEVCKINFIIDSPR